MLSYIKKIISGDSEFYQIKFQGEIYNLYDIETTRIFLKKIKDMLKNELSMNESKREYLEGQLTLVDNLQNHLAFRLNGKTLENDIFAEEYYQDDVDFLNRLKLKVGFKPKTASEYAIYKEVKNQRLNKLSASQKMIEAKKEKIPDDVKNQSLKLNAGTVNNIYAGRLESLFDKKFMLVMELQTRKKDLEYMRTSIVLDSTVEAIRTLDSYPGKIIWEITDELTEKNMRESAEFKRANVDYFDISVKHQKLEEDFKTLFECKTRKKAQIVRELLEYRNLLKRESQLASKKDNVEKSMQTYSRTYR